MNKSNKKILILGDPHLPWPDWDVLEEASKFNKKFKADKVICIGDITDQKTWSRFGRSTSDPGNDQEWAMVTAAASRMHKLFPKLDIIIGNHDIRHLSAADKAGIPKQLVKPLAEALPFKGWKFHSDNDPLVYDNIAFLHGDEENGPVENKVGILGLSVVQGHTHLARIVYRVVKIGKRYKTMFGMDVGSTAHRDSPGSKYAAKKLRKTFVGWATIVDGLPQLYCKSE